MKYSIFKLIKYYITVPRCVGCGEVLDIDDRGLCKACLTEYTEMKKRECSRCAKPLYECSCANKFLENHYVKRHAKVFRYLKHKDKNVSNALIYSLKRENRQDVLELLGDELAVAIENMIGIDRDLVVTSVPRRRRAIVRFGIDHARLLAQNVAQKLGLEYKSMLRSRSKRPQKKLVDRERIRNAEFDVKAAPKKGQRIIIVDDIVTTGASMGSCAALLHSHGAGEILGASLAAAYKDKYEPFAFTPNYK